MIFRFSQKLCTKIKAGKLSEMSLDANPLADWSANLFIADRTQYFILSNTQSLYSCVIYGRGITTSSVFVERALDSIQKFMKADGQNFAYRKLIKSACATVSFAKALNRSVTGSMNDLIYGAKLHLADNMTPQEVGFRLNETPLSALTDSNGRKYGHPREVFLSLVGRYRS